MIFNIHTLKWDDELLKILDIPKKILPKAMPSSCIYGKTDFDYYGGETPIAGAAKVDGTADCYVVPAFTGLGAPYWKQNARGIVVGITRGCSRADHFSLVKWHCVKCCIFIMYSCIYM